MRGWGDKDDIERYKMSAGYELDATEEPFESDRREASPRGEKWTWSYDNFSLSRECDESKRDGCARPFTSWLAAEDRTLCRTLYIGLIGFAAYSSVFGLRSAWRAGSFKRDSKVLGVAYKDALTICYTMSYFVGKIVSAPVLASLSRKNRIPLLLFAILIPTAALGGFAIADDYGRLALMAVAAFPMAFFWCSLYRYVEGRKYTELMGSVMSTSMIVGSGAAKSVGSMFMDDAGISEETMPIVSAAIFAPLFMLFCCLIDLSPPPSESEKLLRGDRPAMTKEQQKKFLTRYWPGLACVCIGNMLLTALRDFRDIFISDMWKDLHDGKAMSSELFTVTEVIVGSVVLVAVALVALVRNNGPGFFLLNAYLVIGALLLGGSQLACDWLVDRGEVGGGIWVTASGIGIFLAYIPLSSMFYDRLVGALGVPATAVFVISVSDCLGYMGSVGLLFFRNYDGRAEGMSHAEFFKDTAMYGSGIMVLCFTACLLYFWHAVKTQTMGYSEITSF